MIANGTKRREAEEFARALEEPIPAGKYADLTNTVALLRAQKQPVPRSDFVADLRAQLMAAADEALAPAAHETAPAQGRATAPIRIAPVHPYRRKLATLAVALTVVGGTAGVATAAQGTLPGDSLYPVKRGLENIQLQLTTSDSARGRDLLAQATTRMQEAHALLRSSTNSRNVSLASEALGSATTSANQGAALLFDDYSSSHASSDVTTVRSFAADQMDALGVIAGLTAAVHPVASQLGDALAAIDQQAHILCLTCSGAPALSLPSTIVNLTAAHSLAALVGAPTQRATNLEELAGKAESIARSTTPVPTGTPDHQASPDTTTSLPSASSLPSALPTPELGHPVRQLLSGLTSSQKDIPGQLVDTVNGLASGVGSTVTGVTGALGGLLGGSSAGATPSN